MKNSTRARLLRQEQKDRGRLYPGLKWNYRQSVRLLSSLRRSLWQSFQVWSSPVIPWGSSFLAWIQSEELCSYNKEVKDD